MNQDTAHLTTARWQQSWDQAPPTVLVNQSDTTTVLEILTVDHHDTTAEISVALQREQRPSTVTFELVLVDNHWRIDAIR